MWPSTSATWLEAATSVDWVTCRELATTLKPRSTNPCTMPAPIPCEAPVTMAVFGGLLIVVYLEKVLSLEKFNGQADQKSASSTMRYRALPDASRAKTSLILLIGKCSVCGTTWCRAAKSSIVAIATGEPTSEPETLRCCRMSENAATGIGSNTAPTTCSRPFGASVPMIASQSSFTLTVLISRLKLPPSLLIAAESLVETAWFAPKPFASSNLLSLAVNAVTSQPYAAANFTAMCPRPPMPMMPTRSVGLAYIANGAKTVTPAHRSGPASPAFSVSGRGMTQAQCARMWLANPPR